MTQDASPSMMEYLLSLAPEEAAAAVKALPKAEQLKLVSGICREVQAMSSAVVEMRDEIWDNR